MTDLEQTDPWAEMDAWCRKRADRITRQAMSHLQTNSRDLESPGYRVLLGQSQAIGQMRSFIHGARSAK